MCSLFAQSVHVLLGSRDMVGPRAFDMAGRIQLEVSPFCSAAFCVFRPMRTRRGSRNAFADIVAISLCPTYSLGLGLIVDGVPFLGLLRRVGDLPGRLSELLLGARLRHCDAVGGWRLVGVVEELNKKFEI